MEFGGRYIVAAPRQKVWAALNDTEVLKAAIPGCHRIEWEGETALALEIKVNLGVVHPVFKGDLALSDIVPAERYTLTGKGKGGLLGLAEGSADIVLVRSWRRRPSWSSPPMAAPPARSCGWARPSSATRPRRSSTGFSSASARPWGPRSRPLPPAP